MKQFENNSIDAICTSPTYGNRMADSHNAKDASKRITYTHMIGHKLSEGNTGGMQWGEKYRNKHSDCYKEFNRILKNGGLCIVNISNHIRNGEEIDVVAWHKSELSKLFRFKEEKKITTPRMGFGQNADKRVHYESILVFIK